MRDDDQHSEDQYYDHMARLDSIRRAFTSGEIGASTKRRYIAEENHAYYGDEKMRSTGTGELLCKVPRIRSEMPGIIADSTGVPVEAARIALDRRRDLYRQAAAAETGIEARQLLEDGAAAFIQILKTAMPRRTGD